jgi:hypothetical protein
VRHISLRETLSGAESESIEPEADGRLFARVCLFGNSGKMVTDNETFGFALAKAAIRSARLTLACASARDSDMTAARDELRLTHSAA